MGLDKLQTDPYTSLIMNTNAPTDITLPNPFDVDGARRRRDIKRCLRLRGVAIPESIQYDEEALVALDRDTRVAQ